MQNQLFDYPYFNHFLLVLTFYLFYSFYIHSKKINKC